jgi:hypothetical protein
MSEASEASEASETSETTIKNIIYKLNMSSYTDEWLDSLKSVTIQLASLLEQVQNDLKTDFRDAVRNHCAAAMMRAMSPISQNEDTFSSLGQSQLVQALAAYNTAQNSIHSLTEEVKQTLHGCGKPVVTSLDTVVDNMRVPITLLIDNLQRSI